LSYREIGELLENSGATAYLDEAAAVQYLVYAENSWVSYDDATTFSAKVDYANRMGLSGIMIWAIDLDDSYLTALQSIVDPSLINSDSSAFDLVNLEYLFPEEDLPPEGTIPTYGLTTVGSDMTDPSSGGFGFLLFAGDSYAVTQLRKRDGLPDPFVFLDCPKDVLDQPDSEIRRARVICLSDDLAGCFRVLEQGVEGTIVEMPDNCAPNTFARAVSLAVSKDQYVPEQFAKQNPTSQVYDFFFDFALHLMRRDTNNTSIRLDYSNVPGYWGSLVDSPGTSPNNQVRSLRERFQSFANGDWRSQFNAADFDYRRQNAFQVKETIDAPLFWQTTEDCPSNAVDFDEGFAAYVSGRVDAQFYFGFSLVAKYSALSGFTLPKQANGFLVIRGESDIEYGIGGLGTVDISRAGRGNPAISEGSIIKVGGETIDAGADGLLATRATFDASFQVSYQMATLNGTDDSDFSDSAVAFDGKLSARVLSDLGAGRVDFPSPWAGSDDYDDDRFPRESNKISIARSNRLYGSPGAGGKIALGTFLRFGMKLKFPFFNRMAGTDADLPEVCTTPCTFPRSYEQLC
jgi:chitinase